MSAHAIRREPSEHAVRLIFDRREEQNSITRALLLELNDHLDQIERFCEQRVVVLCAEGDVFSAGMDFTEFSARAALDGRKRAYDACKLYFGALRRLSCLPRIVVAKVDGRVQGGGVGLVAASDLVIATPRATFSLPEVLWGMLPAMVFPFLDRRMSAHKAYRMALTSQPASAERALDLGLVDEVSENPESNLGRLMSRLSRIPLPSIGRLKHYFDEVCPIDERIADTATNTSADLMCDVEVQQRISAFVRSGELPAESRR